jgi:hypothetical protein
MMTFDRASIPHLESCTVEGVGHLLHIQRPEAVAREVAEFLRANSTPSQRMSREGDFTTIAAHANWATPGPEGPPLIDDRPPHTGGDHRRTRGRAGFGAGIALGYAMCGQVGFEGRFDYAAIGAVTNLASRLADEAGDGQILLTPSLRGDRERSGSRVCRRVHAEGIRAAGNGLQRRRRPRAGEARTAV